MVQFLANAGGTLLLATRTAEESFCPSSPPVRARPEALRASFRALRSATSGAAHGQPDYPLVGLLMVLILSMLCGPCSCASVDRHDVAFPLVLLPMQMAAGARFWRNRIMWAASPSPACWSINYISWLYPSFPILQLKPYSISQFINGLGGVAPLWVAFTPCHRHRLPAQPGHLL